MTQLATNDEIFYTVKIKKKSEVIPAGFIQDKLPLFWIIALTVFTAIILSILGRKRRKSEL